MGGGYSTVDRTVRAKAKGYYTGSERQIFKSRNMHPEMCPRDMTFRESRDSEEHPNSQAIIIALDVTGSMGSISRELVKDGLPMIMQGIIDAGMPDPQLLFLGIGDHECDQAPLQVGQFESSDELLDKWLTSVYLEGGSGGNDGESYFLAWYLAAMHTEIDCFEKRGEKGVLFTIGDEPTLKNISYDALKNIMGQGQYSIMSAAELLEKAMEKYHVFHIHVKETPSGSRQRVVDGWRQMLGDNLLEVQSKNMIPELIVPVLKSLNKTQGTNTPATPEEFAPIEEKSTDIKPEEIML